jgi:hypothetical protein
MLALSAIVAGVVVNPPVCQFISGTVEFPGPYPCIRTSPGPLLVGLAVAVSAVIALAVRVRQRRIGER